MKTRTREALAMLFFLIGTSCLIYVLGALISLGDEDIARGIMGAIYGFYLNNELKGNGRR